MKEILKNKNATMMWFSRTFSRFGDAFESLALMYLIYELTGSALAMGTIMIFSVVPNIIVSPIAGVICDKYYTKHVMFIAELVRAGVIFAIPILHIAGLMQFWMIYVIAVLVSTAESFFEPCAQITMLKSVPKEQMPVYNSVVTTSNQIARLAGYALSGIVMGLAGMDILFVVDAFTFLCSAITIILLKLPKTVSQTNASEKKEEKDDGILSSMKIAAKYVSGTSIPIILFTLILLSVLMAPITEFLPIVSKEMYQQGAEFAGYAMTIVTVGMILGSLVYPIFVKINIKFKHCLLVGNILTGLFVLGSVAIKSIWIGAVIYLVLGMLVSIINVWCSTEIQCSCQIEYLGRVSALLTVVMTICDPLASTISGWAIDVMSVKSVFVIAGILFIAAGSLLYIIYNATEKKHIIQQEMKEKLADA